MEEKGKKLNMLNIISLGVGGAIGSGIFVMMGFGIAYTGRSVVVAVSVGCLYMLLAYLFHPIMASMFVLPGGDYDMKAMLMGPTATGFSALCCIMNGLGLASYGVAFAGYFVSVFTGLSDPMTQKIIAALVMVLFFVLSIYGTKLLANITTVITVVLLASIAIFVVVGAPQVQPGFFSNADGKFWMGGFGGLIGAIAMMSFACQGTTMAAVSVMPATKKPRFTIPVGILIITVIVGLVYGLMGYVAAGVLPVEEVMGQNLSLVAAKIFSPTVFNIFILGGACCAIMSSLASGMTMLRYPLLAVVEDGWLPKFLGKTTKTGYPYVIMGIFLVMSILPIFTPLSVDAMISLIMVPSMLMNAYMNLSMIQLPKKYPEQWKNSTLHMPTPVFYFLCVLGTVCALAVAFYLFKDMDALSTVLCVVLVLGIALLAQIQLRRGAVKKEDLIAKREHIAAAIAATAAADAEGK